MYDRKEVKLRAKTALGANFGLVFGTILVGTLILCAAEFTFVGLFLLAGPISAGLAVVQLAVLRGQNTQFGDMFSGFNNFGTTCGAGVLQMIYIFLWTMLFWIPGIVKMYSYSMTYYILADHPEMSANEAITASRCMMKGHKWDLFVLDLSFFWWYVLCGITFGLAAIYVEPYTTLSRASFYESIKDMPQAQ